MDEVGNFQDWEILQNQNHEMGSNHPSDTSRDFGGIEGDTEGAIRSDYFSLSSDRRFARTPAEVDYPSSGGGEGELSDVSDNPSWVEPSSEPRYRDSARTLDRQNFSDFWSDSGSELSGSQKSLNFEEDSVNGSELGGTADVVSEIPREMESDEALKSGEGGKKGAVWWKVPLELLKFCVFRVSPFWSLSIAAAIVGVMIVGRRLHKLRRKSQSIPLKVTVDDKKVSQFMIRAARLNEAFSIVRRVPMIRPSLPATGVTPWPVMSLR